MKMHLSTTAWRKMAVLLSAIWVLAAADTMAAEGAKVSINNCDIQQGPCTQALGGRRVTLDIEPRPVKAMADLTFKLTIDPGPQLPKPPWIRLNMPAMDMGENRVPLMAVAPGVYQGRGVVVRCRSGLRTWKATVILPEMGSVDFIFDVIY